jgi:hypothetical protein
MGPSAAHIDCEHGENDKELGRVMLEDAKAMVTAAGGPSSAAASCTRRALAFTKWARRAWGMIPRPRAQRYNQAHDVPNLFITDGAAMTSSGCQNPSLTYMAMSARAAYHASNSEGGHDLTGS